MRHDPIPPRPPLDEAFVASLRQRFGDALAMGEGIRRQHGTSEAHFAEALPDAVVFAASTEEVADCVRLCVGAGVAIVPFGAVKVRMPPSGMRFSSSPSGG